MKIVLQIGQNWPILPNISTTTEPVNTNVSAFVDVHMQIIKLTSFAVVQFCFVLDLFARSQSISGSAGLIFRTFAPCGRY